MLKDICDVIEKSVGPSSKILAEFDLCKGHPWEVHASSPESTYYDCLSQLAASVKPNRIAEIGTAFGMSGAALLKACDPVHLYVTMDLGIFSNQVKFDQNNIEYAKSKLHAWANAKNISTERICFFAVNTQPVGTDNYNTQLNVPHWSQIPELVELLLPAYYDVLFVDGKHTGEGLYNDIMSFWSFLRPGGLLICDDLHEASIYKKTFEWAGDTLNSFHRAVSELTNIEDSYIWDFPRVSTPGIMGLRPFGVIKKGY
jgi:predicted O-methyltransferase YrrM